MVCQQNLGIAHAHGPSLVRTAHGPSLVRTAHGPSLVSTRHAARRKPSQQQGACGMSAFVCIAGLRVTRRRRK